MRASVVGSLALISAALASPAVAEIEWDYVKPDYERSTGEWLSDILGVSEFGRSYAVIIGLHRYEHFNPLHATEPDPERVFEFLRDEAGFDYILMLRDDAVSYDRLRTLFEFELPNTLESNDRFLLFWSGHGTQFKNALGTELGYLPLISSSQDNKATMVNMKDLTRWDSELPAKHSLFLLDACFSGLAGATAQSDAMDLEISELAQPGHHIISAGGRNQQTIASRQEWQGSIFTHALLKALRGDADRYGGRDGGDGVINLYELVANMGETVKHAKAAAGWKRPLRPILNVFPDRGEGQFFFLTRDKKRAYLEAQGRRVADAMAHGMPIVMGTLEGSTTPSNNDSYGGRDAAVFSVIQGSMIAKDFEDFLAQFPESVFAPYARNRLALLRKPPQPRAVALDPAALEASLNLRHEDRTIIQEALLALAFDAGGIDGIFGAKTRRAIAGWQEAAGEQPTGYLTSSQYGWLLAEAKPKLAALETARGNPEQPSSVGPLAGAYHYQPGYEFRDCEKCPLMTVVSAGSFTMGSGEAERKWAVDQGAAEGWVDWERPQHRVTIAQPFAVGKYEVTRDQFAAFVRATGHDMSGGCWQYAEGWNENPSINWESPGFRQTDRDPVVCVSWEDANAYVTWLSEETGHGYRLPSEAQWEYAARAATNSMRPWGDDSDNEAGCAYANGADLSAKEKFDGWTTMNCRDGRVHTASVGSYRANAFALHDMIGNAWEWVADCWHDSHQGAEDDGRARVSGDCRLRVLRGGSWFSDPWFLRSAVRSGDSTDIRYDSVGFRVARTLPQSESANP